MSITKHRDTFLNLIEITGSAVKRNESMTDSNKHLLNQAALKKGYIIAPDAYMPEVYSFIENRAEYNATFYKNWSDIVSKNRIELFLDQIRHYASTYGTDYQGEPWIPNKELDMFLPFEKFKVIYAITPEEMYQRVMSMLSSGMALKNTVVDTLCDYIVWCLEDGIVRTEDFDIDSIKNKQAIVQLCDSLRIYPTNCFALLRYIVYKTTGESQIIQNDALIRSIKTSSSLKYFDFGRLNDKQLHSLASIFLRYKRVFLAFRSTSRTNRIIINKIRRYAVKDHKPFKAGILQTLLSISDNDIKQKSIIEQIKKALEGGSTFDLVRIFQAGQERLLTISGDVKQYIVRNGKVFNKRQIGCTNTNAINIINALVYCELIKRIQQTIKPQTIVMPDELVITAPTSEKNFVGALPYGSYIPLGEDNYFGIYWREEDGTRDFDLHFFDVEGHRFGWNGSYHDDNIVFSGDMTSANPEATEIFYCKDTLPNGIVHVNRYNGKPNSKYRIFFGKDSNMRRKLSRGYMVNPNTVILDQPMISETMAQQCVGAIIDGKFYFMQLSNGNSIGSHCNKWCNPQDYTNIIQRKAQSFISLDSLFREAGYTVLSKSAYESLEEKPEVLDLSEPTKEQMISIFK